MRAASERPARPTSRARSVALGVVAMLALSLAAPAAAAAVTEDFESPPLAGGTEVSTHFEANGIYFSENHAARIYYPEIADDVARSPSRSLDITTGPAVEEFQRPGLQGHFTDAVEDLTVRVRNLFPTPASITLEGLLSGGGTESATTAVPPGSWVDIGVGAGSGTFHGFRLSGDNGFDGGKEIRVDDIEYEVDPLAEPDYQLSTEVVGGVALPGQPKQIEIQIQRLNGFSDSVSFLGNVFGAAGESIEFTPNPASGDSTTMTLTLPSDAAEDPSAILRVRGEVAGEAASTTRILDIPITIESPFRIEAVTPLPVTADRCATTPAGFRVVRNRFFDDPVQLRVEPGGGAIPPDIAATVAPTTILSLEAVNPVTLNVARGDTAEIPGPVPLRIVAASGGVERSVPVDVVRAPPRLTSAAPTTLFAPVALGGGTGITVRGNGICPGATVRFGNEAADAPAAFTPIPAAGDPTRAQLNATTPRLATDGQVSVVNPSGAVFGGTGLLAADVRSYRDNHGFSFPNEDSSWDDVNKDGVVNAADEPRPVGAGALRDWQELLGPHQTNLNACEVGLALPGCWELITPIPTPQHLLMQTILGEAAYYQRDGTCIGFAIASRRISTGQTAVHGRPGPTTAPVWSLRRDGRETIPGRGDIPLEGRADYSPIKYAAILHPAQTTAEYVELWSARRTHNALSGPNAMRRALERDLRAGRRPLLNFNYGDGGHAVNVYDIEDRPGGGYFIRVYDNNLPYMASEAGNAVTHRFREEERGRVEVTPGGSWTYPGLRITVGRDAAGNPIREGRSGPSGDLSWVTVENELPVVPSSLAHLEGLRALATPGLGSASIAAPADAAKGAKAGVLRLGLLDAEGSIVTARSDRPRRLAVRPGRDGATRVGVFGEGAVAEVRASGSGARASAAGGGDRVILPRGETAGVGFKAGAASTRVDLTVASEDSGRLVRLRGARGGTTQVKLVGKGDRVRIDHDGRPGPVRIELAGFGRRDAAARLVTGMRLGAGARVTLLPNWKHLGRKLVVKVNGKRRVLRNRVRPQVRVKRLRVSSKQRRGRAVTRVRARLRGKLGKLDALVVGLEVRRGRKLLGRAFRQLPPNRKAARRLARKGVVLRPELKSRRGRLRVRATVSTVIAKPLPSGDTRSRRVRVR